MKTEPNKFAIQPLGKALKLLNPINLEPHRTRALAEALVQRLKTEQDIEVLDSIGKSLSLLCAKLEPKDAQQLADVLMERMKSELDSVALFAVGRALVALSSDSVLPSEKRATQSCSVFILSKSNSASE